MTGPSHQKWWNTLYVLLVTHFTQMKQDKPKRKVV